MGSPPVRMNVLRYQTPGSLDGAAGTTATHGRMGLADAVGLGVGRSGRRSRRSSARMTRLDDRLAPDQQAAQQADLARDQVGRAQARRIEAEDRDPALWVRPHDEAVLVGDPDLESLRRAADVARNERREPSRGIQVDGVDGVEPTEARPTAARRSSITGSAAATSAAGVVRARRTASRGRRRGSAACRPARPGPACAR